MEICGCGGNKAWNPHSRGGAGVGSDISRIERELGDNGNRRERPKVEKDRGKVDNGGSKKVDALLGNAEYSSLL